MKTDPNQQTINAYALFAVQYIENTPKETPDFVGELIDKAVLGMPKDARILELGSASGREAAYLQARGFSVECSEVVPAFIDVLTQKGFKVRKLNAITDDLGGPYEVILANAVLVHFTRQQTEQTLRKVLAALSDHGVFACTLLAGDGEKMAEDKLGAPRYFCFWTEKQIRTLLLDVGFKDVEISVAQSAPWATWLQIIAHA